MFKLKNDDDGRTRWLERRYDLLAAEVGFDVAQSPTLAPVVTEIRAGNEIKAAQVYSKLFDCPLSEAIVAVADLTARLPQR